MSDPERPIRVETYSGMKADEEPRALWVEGRRLRVLGIADRWYDPAAAYFKVRAEDGSLYLLRHDSRRDAWQLVRVFATDA
jgi:hypothetical protein